MIALFSFDFMQHAFVACFAASLLAGCIGYLLVLRAASFAGHALSHIAFAGASAALLVGLPPLTGMIAVPVAAGVAIGAIERRAGTRAGGAASDVAIGLLLAMALALGLLCLHYATGSVSGATSLLFGNVLGIDIPTLRALCVLTLVALLTLAALYRRLLFVILQPDLAEARGLPVRLLGMAFMALAALCVAGCAQIVGVLLTFALTIAPAAAAQRLTRRPGTGMALSATLAVVQSWAGLVAAYFTDWPVSVWIVVFGALTWLAAWGARAALDRRQAA